MTSRFFLPVKAAARVTCLFLLGSVGLLHGQTETDPASSPTPKPKLGYVRFWNLLPVSAGRLELVGASNPSGQSLLGAVPESFAVNYRALPPAHYSWAVCSSADRQKPLKNLTDVALGADGYLTIVARPPSDPNGHPVVEVINDIPDPAQPAGNCLTIYQCSPDARVVVTAGRRYISDPLNYAGTQVLKDLPDGIVGLAITITTKAGSRSWNTEADFRASPRASLVVVADSYNRIRPRITVDGVPRSASSPETPNAPTPSAPLTR